MAFELLETITVGSGGIGAIDFQAIPQDARDLKILASSTGQNGNANTYNLRFNNLTSGYEMAKLQQTGTSLSAPSVNNGATITIANQGEPDWGAFANYEITIYDYATNANPIGYAIGGAPNISGTTMFQTIAQFGNSSTSAVASIQLFSSESLTFAEHSTFSLYKIY